MPAVPRSKGFAIKTRRNSISTDLLRVCQTSLLVWSIPPPATTLDVSSDTAPAPSCPRRGDRRKRKFLYPKVTCSGPAPIEMWVKLSLKRLQRHINRRAQPMRASTPRDDRESDRPRRLRAAGYAVNKYNPRGADSVGRVGLPCDFPLFLQSLRSGVRALSRDVNAGEKARLFAAAARRARSARHAQRAVLAQNDGSSSNPSRS